MVLLQGGICSTLGKCLLESVIFMDAVYVHIPFCVSKCFYCDFNSIGIGRAAPPELAYVEALGREADRWEKSLLSDPHHRPDTLFFGGGTPSLFSPDSFQKIIQKLDSVFFFHPETEKTMELNPKTADLAKMIQYRAAGLNRLSIGVQSLNDDLLHRLGRAHSSQEALQAIEWGLNSGMKRLSIDLMYGLPEQQVGDVENSLKRLIDFPLKHFSAYELILEEETEFFKQYRRGRLPLPEEEKVFAMKGLIDQFAKQKGMSPYEVSNYGQSSEQSRHNLHYWNYDSFVGLGAGAVSFLKATKLNQDFSSYLSPELTRSDIYGYRLSNPRPLDSYQNNSHLWDEVLIEPISYPVAMGEYMMMGLRKISGIRFADMREKMGRSIPLNFFDHIEDAKKNGWMEGDEEGCRLTAKGMLFSNEVLQKFFQ